MGQGGARVINVKTIEVRAARLRHPPIVPRASQDKRSGRNTTQQKPNDIRSTRMRARHTAHSTPNFPVYSVAFLSPGELVLGGGGGASKTGIKNKLVRRPTLEHVTVPDGQSYSAAALSCRRISHSEARR